MDYTSPDLHSELCIISLGSVALSLPRSSNDFVNSGVLSMASPLPLDGTMGVFDSPVSQG